jgi:hypothetical protein
MKLGNVSGALAVVCIGCGIGAPDPSQSSSSAAITSPPPADALPDGGTTADGSPASPLLRLRTQVGWFLPQARTCTVMSDEDSVMRSYSQVKITLDDDIEGQWLFEWTLTGGAGAVSVDTYHVALFPRPTDVPPSITTMSDQTTYQYETSSGYSEGLLLREGVSDAQLVVSDGDSDLTVSCLTD